MSRQGTAGRVENIGARTQGGQVRMWPALGTVLSRSQSRTKEQGVAMASGQLLLDSRREEGK